MQPTKCKKCGAGCFEPKDFMTHCCEPPQTHTPGPWTISEVTKDKSEFHSLIGNRIEGWVVAGVYKHPKLKFNGLEHVHVNTADRKARALADARLIACAPELLEALNGMMEWARRVKGINPGPEIAIALNVIAKAEGK